MTKEKGFLLNKKILNDTKLICDLPLCKFLLMNDSNYPWFILVPKRPNIIELFDLSKEERNQLDNEIYEVSKFINDNTLLNQIWIMDPKKKVSDILKEIKQDKDIKILSFLRYKVGEGI